MTLNSNNQYTSFCRYHIMEDSNATKTQELTRSGRIVKVKINNQQEDEGEIWITVDFVKIN